MKRSTQWEKNSGTLSLQNTSKVILTLHISALNVYIVHLTWNNHMQFSMDSVLPCKMQLLTIMRSVTECRRQTHNVKPHLCSFAALWRASTATTLGTEAIRAQDPDECSYNSFSDMQILREQPTYFLFTTLYVFASNLHLHWN